MSQKSSAIKIRRQRQRSFNILPGRAAMIALALGGASATGFAPLSFWPVTFLCLAGLILLTERAKTLREAAGIGWWFGVGNFSIGLNWIATAFTFQDNMPHWLGGFAVVGLSLYLALYTATGVALAWRVGQRSGMLALGLSFGAAWIVSEWLRATLFTGFAWNPIGVVLVDIGQVTRWIGTYGLSGIVILGAAALAALARMRWRSALILAIPLAATVALALTLPPALPPSEQSVRVRIVQPNINQNEKTSATLAERNFQRLALLTGRTTLEPRLILWPEAAVPYFLEEEGWARQRIAALLGPDDVVLTGGDALIYGEGGLVTAARNSLFAMDSRAQILARYDKSHLVPYGEYLPMRPMLSAIGLSRLVPGDFDFIPGPGPQTITLPHFGKVGIQICYEMIFSGQVVDAKHRPDFIFNPSNDAWFGSWGPPQHLAQARLRAIEEGLPVMRSTPTGISALVNADGKILEQVAWKQPGAISANLPPPLPPTLFSQKGNMLPLLFAAALAALAFIAIAVRRLAR